MLKNRTIRNLLLILSLILPIVIFSLTAYRTYGWDDEYFSINSIERQNYSFSGVINYINHNDLHPVGMYVVALFLFKIFRSWSIVRVFAALLVASALWIYWFVNREEKDDGANFLTYLLLCLNPSILLWCSGLRWYTWILFFVCFLGILMNKSSENFSRNGTIKFWGLTFLLYVLMFHVSYFAAIIILASFICICYERRASLQQESKIFVSLGLTSIILISWQAYYLLTVHYPTGKGLLTSSIFFYVINAGQYFLTGSALVPVSIFGIFSTIAGVILFAAFVLNFRRVIKSCSSKVFIISCLMNILMKVAVAARYYTILAPLYADFMKESFLSLKNKKLRAFILAAYFISNVGGIYAVMTHSNTLKASWNTPYAEIINHVSGLDESKEILVATSNTVLEWWLKKDGFDTMNFFYDNKSLESLPRPVIVVKTFKGSLSDQRYQELNDFIKAHEIKAKFEVGRDDYAWFKRKLNKDYPDIYAEIFLIE